MRAKLELTLFEVITKPPALVMQIHSETNSADILIPTFTQQGSITTAHLLGFGSPIRLVARVLKNAECTKADAKQARS